MTKNVRTGYGIAAGRVLYRLASFCLGLSVILAIGLILVRQAAVAIGLVVSLWLLQQVLGKAVRAWKS
jgi:hypothetical protein